MPVLRLPSLADKGTMSRGFISPGTVPQPSGHGLTPETLKRCVAMVKGSDHYLSPKGMSFFFFF